MAIIVVVLAWPVPIRAVVSGGIAGAFVDSLLGATLQERRWCPACGRFTERPVHRCGAATIVRGGMAGFGNDGVNLVSVVAGAIVTVLLS